MGFNCKVCRRDERLDPSWLHHIASLGHQRALTRLPSGGQGEWDKSPESRNRAIQILGCTELKASTLVIVEYLVKNGGPVEEFICPTSLSGTKPNIIYCLFKDSSSVAKILELEKPSIFRQPVTIERRFGWGGWGDDDLPLPSMDLPDSESKPIIKTEPPPDPKKEDKNSSHTVNGEAKIAIYSHKGTFEPKRTRETTRRIPPKFHEQLQALYSKHNNINQRMRFCKELQQLLRFTFSNCVVFTSGTESLGISLDSDCSHFCVDPYGKFATKNLGVITTLQSDATASGMLLQLLLTLKNPDGSPRFTFVSAYSVSRAEWIPEISFKFYDSIRAKVKFENFVSVQKSRCIKFLMNHDVRVLPLFSLLRHWSVKNEVLHEQKEGEEFEGYILILLMIFYLSHTKSIPCVAKLRHLSLNYPLLIDNIDMSFCSDKKLVPNAKTPYLDDPSTRGFSVLGVLKDFFKFFAELKFYDKVVCSTMGKIIDKQIFRPHLDHKLPSELAKIYRYNIDGSLREETLNIFTPMVVQDIFDLTENVASAVDETELALFQRKCHEGVLFLQEVQKNEAGDLSVIFGNQIPEEEWPEEVYSEKIPLPTPPPPPKLGKITLASEVKTEGSPKIKRSRSQSGDEDSNSNSTDSNSAGGESSTPNRQKQGESSTPSRPQQPERILRDPKAEPSSFSSPFPQRMTYGGGRGFNRTPQKKWERQERRPRRDSGDFDDMKIEDDDEMRDEKPPKPAPVVDRGPVCRIPIYPHGSPERGTFANKSFDFEFRRPDDLNLKEEESTEKVKDEPEPEQNIFEYDQPPKSPLNDEDFAAIICQDENRSILNDEDWG